MRREKTIILIIVVALTLIALAAALSASTFISSHRLAVLGGTRPTLTSNAGGFDGASSCTKTLSVTPPVGTSLLIVYASAMRESGNTNFDMASLTLGGTALDQLTSFATNSTNHLWGGFAYKINPTTGVAQDIVMTCTSSVAWNDSLVYAWMFSGTDPADPFGQVASVSNINQTSISTSFQPEYNRPYIVAGSVTRRAGGDGNCYSATNLTIVNQGNAGDENTAGAAANNTSLTGAGPTTFTMNCSFSTSSGTGTLMAISEIKGP